MHYFDSGGAMAWGGLWMVLWLVLPILGIVALVTWMNRSGSNRQEITALDILKERYARGEIDQAEFEQKRRDLEA
ncbi:MAG: SHOCT domain-containing protein [Pseudomonadota bacterium]